MNAPTHTMSTTCHHGKQVILSMDDQVRHMGDSWDVCEFWTHPQLPAEPGESEDDYIERFSEFANANQGREIRGLE